MVLVANPSPALKPVKWLSLNRLRPLAVPINRLPSWSAYSAMILSLGSPSRVV